MTTTATPRAQAVSPERPSPQRTLAGTHPELPPQLQWLAAFPHHANWFEISPVRAYAHPEADYDNQYKIDPENLVVGRGAVRLLQAKGCDFGGPALEIGCGTGQLTLGLVDAAAYPSVLVTDPSPEFLALTQRKLNARPLGGDTGCLYASLTGEDLHLLPTDSFSLVVLRSVLHHVLDVGAFIGQVARVLRPGGALLCEEPCSEGYLLMGMIAQFIPVVMEHAGRPLSAAQVKQLEFFVQTIRFYLRRDVDKSAAEDKHLFRTEEMAAIGARHGLDFECLANFHLEQFLEHDPDSVAPFDPYQFMKAYLRYCMNFGPELPAAFDSVVAPYAEFLRQSSIGWSGPLFKGVFLWKKR